MRVDSSLTSLVKVSCERKLIRCFKHAAAVEEQRRNSSGLGQTGNGLHNGVECVRKAFRSSQLQKGLGNKSAAAVFDCFSKREVVQMLQKQAPLEFLRQHRLNGSEAVV